MKPASILSLALLAMPAAAQHGSIGSSSNAERIPSPPPPAIDLDRKTETAVAPAKVPGASRAAVPGAAVSGGAVPLPPKPPVANGATRSVSRVPSDQVFLDVPGDGRIWARGATYKAGFDSQGAAYIPFFGSDAPRNYPVRFSLRSLRVGGQDVAFKRDGEARLAGQRVSIARQTVTEVYDVMPDGIEQSFVFTALPAAGDLVVRVDVATELVPSQSDGGVRFGNDLGWVEYGAATVLDAAGNRAAASRTFDDGALVLTAPAWFLADATFPVTIDPRVSTFSVRPSTSVEHTADIAYEAGLDRYLLVWEEAFSVLDHDIVSVLQDAAGVAVPNSLAYIEAGDELWVRPRVASLRATQQFLTVAVRGLEPTRQIWARTRSANTLVPLGTPFEVTTSATAGDKFNADVGGDPSLSGPSYWTVVWERTFSATDSDIHARQVLPDGTLRGSVILVDNDSTHDTHPAISKSNGGPPAASQDWIVVWQRTYLPGDEDIRFARIHWDGVVSTPSSPLNHSVNNETNPAVSSPTGDQAGRTWLVAYEETFGPGVSDVMVSLGRDGARIHSANLMTLENRGDTRPQALPHVDSDGCRFTVVYNELHSAQFNDWDVFATTCHVVHGATLGISEAAAVLAFDVTPEMRPRITSTRSGGGEIVRYAGVWDETVRTNPLDIDIKGALHDGRAGYNGFTHVYTGCNGLGLTPSGLGTVGGSVGFQLTGIVNGNLPVMMFGLPLGPGTACGGCGLGVNLGTAFFVGGATLVVPIPNEGAFVGGTVAGQGLTVGTGPCLGQVSLSDTVRCTIQ